MSAQDDSGFYIPTADDQGVYRFVKALWSERDVGHLFFVKEGWPRTYPITLGAHGTFDFYPELVSEGHLVKLDAPELEALMVERIALNDRIQTAVHKLNDSD